MIPFSYENPPAFLKDEEYYLLEVTNREGTKRIIAEWYHGEWGIPGFDYDTFKMNSYNVNIIAEINTTTLKMKKLTPPRRPIMNKTLTPLAKSNLASVDNIRDITIHEFINLYFELYMNRHLDPMEVIAKIEANCERLGFSKNVVHLHLLMDAQQTTKHTNWSNDARRR